MKKLLFIGNFVNDIILIHEDLQLQRERSFSDFLKENNGETVGKVTKNTALGGSVTYASLATNAFGGATSIIISNLGTDINESYKSMIESKSTANVSDGTINTDYIKKTDGLNTSYQLNYYNRKKNRTLLLLESGESIDLDQCLKCLDEQKPDALSFVPIAGEIDVDVIVELLDHIAQMPLSSKPKIIAFDVQGLLRTFNGTRVTTHSRETMLQRLNVIGSSLKNTGVISILKAEYGEAIAIIGISNNDISSNESSSSSPSITSSKAPLSPGECAQILRNQFNFTLTSVTMGGDGGFISSGVTGEVYIPTFKPAAVMDETGCGDTFLSCTMLELLETLARRSVVDESVNEPFERYQLSAHDIVHCVEVGSAGASFLVEQIGPNGFASQSAILERVNNGQKQSKSIYLTQQHEHQLKQKEIQAKSTTTGSTDIDSTTTNSFSTFKEGSSQSSSVITPGVTSAPTTTTTITKLPKSTTFYN